MRSSSSSYSSLDGAVILLLVLTAAVEAEAIRLDAGTRASVGSSSNSNQMAIDKPTGDNVINNVVKGSADSISEKKRSADIVADKVMVVADKLPEFHEDYYGPSDHSPRHH